MKYFIFRNQTVEPFFGTDDAAYSGYDDISLVPTDADAYIWFYQVPVSADAATLAQEIGTYESKLRLVLSQVDAAKPFVIFSLENLFPLRLTGDEMDVRAAVDNFNATARTLALDRGNVKWVDFSEFLADYDSATLINWKYYFISQTLLSPKLAQPFHRWWQGIEAQMASKRKKCLVLDLDNTLWQGVLGEDGIDGIKIGGDYPGKAFAYWQNALLQLARTGVILTICSKNNLADVEEAWDKNPFMVLKKEHFSAMRINWNDKATNIRELADELNIGLDSMVFVDDNPAERELIRQALPMVAVPDFPAKPYELMPFFKQLAERYFRIYRVTDEDRKKTEQYRANARRREAQAQFVDFDDYLRSLQIHIDIRALDEHNLARIAQMTQKTNQFNLTTRRYTEADVRRLADEGWHIYCIAVSDRFGDNGITGAIFVKPTGSAEVDIDTLLLSCRILGRGIEGAFFSTIMRKLKDMGVNEVTATYLPTAKNSQVADFYDRMGMTPTADGRYRLDLRGSDFPVKDLYDISLS